MKKLPCEDLFVLSGNYRAIFDNYIARTEADELWDKTKDFDKVDKFCERIKRKQESAALLAIQSRLEENFILITLDGDDYRQKGR